LLRLAYPGIHEADGDIGLPAFGDDPHHVLTVGVEAAREDRDFAARAVPDVQGGAFEPVERQDRHLVTE